MDLRFLDPNGQPTREAFNERFEFLNALTPRIGNISSEYVWEKCTSKAAYDTTLITLTLDSQYCVADSISVENGLFVLNDYKVITFTSNDQYTAQKGKFFYYPSTNGVSTEVCRFPDNYVYGGKVEYLTNPRSELTLVGYVNSPDPNSYPPAVDDGFTYKLLGQLANLGAKIETGSYTGTGTYGASNPNSLTFGFEPKLVMLGPANAYVTCIALRGTPTAILFSTNQGSIFPKLTWSGNTLQWYSTGDKDTQLNNTTQYAYIAIG